jgi:hypothetical protein
MATDTMATRTDTQPDKPSCRATKRLPGNTRQPPGSPLDVRGGGFGQAV